MAIALNHSRARGAAKLVLIGIANHDGDGGAWPAIATLARYSGVHPRNVQRAIDQLESLGEISRLRGQGGNHLTAEHMRPNLYRFLLACPHDCDRTSQHRTRNSVVLMQELDLSTGVALAPGGGAHARGGVALAPPEPSLNHPTTDKEIGSGPKRARESAKNDGLSPDSHSLASLSPAELYSRLLHEKCGARRDGKAHAWIDSGYCLHCGNRRPDSDILTTGASA